MPTPAARHIILLLILAFASQLPAAASDAPIARIRVESLDDALADAGRLASPAGHEVSREQVLSMALAAFGVTEASWLDGTRPIVAVLPMAGMLLGEKGIVAAFPVTDAAAAIEAIAASFDGHSTVDDLHHLVRGEETSLFVIPTEGYLIASPAREIALAFELNTALATDDLPPGNIVFEVLLEPLAPLAQMGLMQGRQAMEQELAGETEGGEGGNEGDAQAMPAAAGELLGLYFDLANDVLNNTSKVQVSLEVTENDVVLHTWLTPRAESTLAGLLAAQKGGLPKLVRMLESKPVLAAGAGQMRPTPEFLAALAGYAERYTASMRHVTEAAGETLGTAWMGMMEMSGTVIDRAVDCYSGSFGGTFDIDPDDGMRGVQIVGLRDRKVCEEMIAESIRLIGELPPAAGGEPVVTVTENALRHRGVSAMRQETRLDLFAAEEGEAAQFGLQALFGDESVVGYVGLADDLMLYTTGPGAESGFKGLVERLSARKGGLDEASFAPLKTGPGYFFFLDVARLFEVVPATLLGNQDLPEFPERPGDPGSRVVAGLRLAGRLELEIAVPLPLIDAVASMSRPGGGERAGDHDGKHDHDTDHAHAAAHREAREHDMAGD